VIGSWVGVIFNILVLIAQFWTGISPVGWEEMTADELVINFFQAYLAAPVVVVSYIVYKIWKKTKILRTRDMDLFTGKREMNIKGLLMEEKAERKRWPLWKKLYKFFC